MPPKQLRKPPKEKKSRPELKGFVSIYARDAPEHSRKLELQYMKGDANDGRWYYTNYIAGQWICHITPVLDEEILKLFGDYIDILDERDRHLKQVESLNALLRKMEKDAHTFVASGGRKRRFPKVIRETRSSPIKSSTDNAPVEYEGSKIIALLDAAFGSTSSSPAASGLSSAQEAVKIVTVHLFIEDDAKPVTLSFGWNGGPFCLKDHMELLSDQGLTLSSRVRIYDIPKQNWKKETCAVVNFSKMYFAPGEPLIIAKTSVRRYKELDVDKWAGVVSNTALKKFVEYDDTDNDDIQVIDIVDDDVQDLDRKGKKRARTSYD